MQHLDRQKLQQLVPPLSYMPQSGRFPGMTKARKPSDPSALEPVEAPETTLAETTLDAHGFDPNEFDWRPVPRRRRYDGWTPEVQRKFIEALADTGLVNAAAAEVDMSEQSAYRLLRSPGSQGFARAWEAAVAHAGTRLIDVAFRRAIEGEDIPVFDRDGCRIGSRRRYNDRLLMFLIRALRPDRYRHGHEDTRQPGEVPPPPILPVEEAVAALEPVRPAEPHLLMAPEALTEAIETARDMQEVYERHPLHDREHFVYPRVEADHAAATERRLKRRARERRAWERKTHDDDDDDE